VVATTISDITRNSTRMAPLVATRPTAGDENELRPDETLVSARERLNERRTVAA
jgi:hypothetical protein